MRFTVTVYICGAFVFRAVVSHAEVITALHRFRERAGNQRENKPKIEPLDSLL